MLQRYKGHILLTVLVALLFLLSACGTSALANNTASPQQTLQNSAKAMSQLKSVHFDLQATLNLQSASTTNGGASGISFNVTGHGDAATSDQVDMDLLLGQNPLLSVVSTAGKVYVQSQGGTWYVVNQSKVTAGVQKFFSQEGLSKQLGQITSELKNAELIDHGPEVLNGETLDHITATLDAQTLQTLSSQLNGLLPAKQQSSQNVFNQATLDLWIDQSTWYVHQAELNLAVHVDLSKLPALNFNGQNMSLPAEVLPVSLKAQFNFSKFNQPVTIQAPSDASPLPLQ
jgi:hypothetical protein